VKIRQRDVTTGAVKVRNYIKLLPQKMSEGAVVGGREAKNAFKIFQERYLSQWSTAKQI